jgi:hypothetical protein
MISPTLPQKDKIWEILKKIRNEGLNVAFYKAAWHWIGDYLNIAILAVIGKKRKVATRIYGILC